MKKWELINFCELDQPAIQSYCAIHNVSEDKNLGDITKVNANKIGDFDFLSFGFCCQDISIAGRQLGFVDANGEKTRSGLYYDAIEILRVKKPKFAMIENVKNLTGKKFSTEFNMILNDLSEAGYNVYYKVLDSQNYGVPQHRERIYILAIRKDVDNGKFVFPSPIKSDIKLKDLLEDDSKIADNFFLSEKAIAYMSRERNGKPRWEYHVNNYEGVACTLTANMWKGVPYGVITNKPGKKRRLTPCECFQLQGFLKEDFFAAKENGVSNTNLYKQTGNSITVNVLYYIYKELYLAMPDLFDNLKVTSLFSGIGAFEKALNNLYEDINNDKI